MSRIGVHAAGWRVNDLISGGPGRMGEMIQERCTQFNLGLRCEAVVPVPRVNDEEQLHNGAEPAVGCCDRRPRVLP